MMKKILPALAILGCIGFAMDQVYAAQNAEPGAAQNAGQGAAAGQAGGGRRGAAQTNNAPGGGQGGAPAGATEMEHGQPVGNMRMGFANWNVPPEVAARGKGIYSTNCSFCHGSDAAGAVGPNLRVSQVVLSDKNGELLAPIVHGALVDKGMPRVELTEAQISDVAGFLHSLAGTRTPPEKINILVGNATDGKATFDRMCSSCHTPESIAYLPQKIADPAALQQAWLLPGGPGRGGFAPPPLTAGVSKATPATATITTGPNQTVTGTVDRIDDFYVSITLPNGKKQSFERNGDQPKVVYNDPAAPHKELFRKYTDKEIHDITAYLVTLR
jgi:cytochrome c oxidase cbb3-type subunit 3